MPNSFSVEKAAKALHLHYISNTGQKDSGLDVNGLWKIIKTYWIE